MKNNKSISITFAYTSLLYVSIALYGFASGKVSRAPVDPYEIIAEASVKRSK